MHRQAVYGYSIMYGMRIGHNTEAAYREICNSIVALYSDLWCNNVLLGFAVKARV
jgi:hypothetical protein